MLGKPFGICLERECERSHLLGDRGCLHLHASPGTDRLSRRFIPSSHRAAGTSAPLGPGFCLGKHPLCHARISHGSSEILPGRWLTRAVGSGVARGTATCQGEQGSARASLPCWTPGMPAAPLRRRAPVLSTVQPGGWGAGGVEGLGPTAEPLPLQAALVWGMLQHSGGGSGVPASPPMLGTAGQHFSPGSNVGVGALMRQKGSN